MRKLAIAAGEVTTFAGLTQSGWVDGVGTAARINMPANRTDGAGALATLRRPEGIMLDAKGSVLFVCDYRNDEMRRVFVY